MGDDKTTKPLDPTSPYYLHPSDGPQITISPIVLRRENYNEWVRSMRNNFRAKNKLGFLDGTIPKPDDGTPEASLWVTVHSTLVGWIHNTLDPVLRSSVPQPEDVKDMWDDIRQRFSIGNGPQIHELKSLLGACKQRGHSVVHYYNELRKIWDELAGYSTAPTCTCAAATVFAQEKENEKVHAFLVGLDSNLYGTAVSHILMMDPLPSLNTVFAKIVTEERHQSIARDHATNSDTVGFAVHGTARGRTGRPRSNGVCSHCDKPRHEQENCFQLVGFPDWWYSENRTNGVQGRGGGRTGRGGGKSASKGGRGQVAHATITSKPIAPTPVQESDRRGIAGLSDDQWATLVNLLNNSQGQSSSTEKLSGKFDSSAQWIIDTGCSNHMTGNAKLFSQLFDVSPTTVGLPNGQHTIATKEGTVFLSKNTVPRHVLYAPNLTFNLMFVSHLLADLSYYVTFIDKLCIIQDCALRTMIGAGE
ncbi:uncharacterized protein [Henckelia pumila]|uniref:uncharacterized protein n=1 Tax=Henckelia pumila TaxID=405737 RepID=UPI003C6E3999